MCPAEKLHFLASITARTAHKMLEEVIVWGFQEMFLKGTDFLISSSFSPFFIYQKDRHDDLSCSSHFTALRSPGEWKPCSNGGGKECQRSQRH